jgi:ribonuclease R
MRDLAGKMRALRLERGSLDFEIPEPKVVLDDDDPTRVRDVQRSRGNPEVKEAYRMIEDFMLAANEAVARFFRERALDTLWRVHDVPKQERLEEFAAIAESFGVPFSVEQARSPKALRDFLERLRGKPMERALSFLLLRSLKQAVYDVVNVGHFGLAAPDYLHFTSPIRRYPDLIVHRLVKNQLRAEGQPAGGVHHAPPPPREELASWAAESSSNERRAMEAEREVVDMYRAWLMRDRVGESYDATVVGVTNFGLFVEVAEPFVEGLIKPEKLGGSGWQLDERTVRLTQPGSGRSFAMGDAVRVRVENVSVQRRKIDFALESHQELAPRAEVRGRGRDGKRGERRREDQKRARRREKDGRGRRHR